MSEHSGVFIFPWNGFFRIWINDNNNNNNNNWEKIQKLSEG